jgi:hypothetical protein
VFVFPNYIQSVFGASSDDNNMNNRPMVSEVMNASV